MMWLLEGKASLLCLAEQLVYWYGSAAPNLASLLRVCYMAGAGILKLVIKSKPASLAVCLKIRCRCSQSAIWLPQTCTTMRRCCRTSSCSSSTSLRCCRPIRPFCQSTRAAARTAQVCSQHFPSPAPVFRLWLPGLADTIKCCGLSQSVEVHEGAVDGGVYAGAWLEVLQNLLVAMHIPHRIVIGAHVCCTHPLRCLQCSRASLSSDRASEERLIYLASSNSACGKPLDGRLICHAMGPHLLVLLTGGSLTRAKDQARIDFLAQARNRALEPLWLNNSMATSTSLLLPHDPEVGQADSSCL